MELPAPKVNHNADGLEISIDGVPGVEYKYIKYTVNDKTFFGELLHEVDGRWYHRNPKTSFHHGKLEYKIVAEKNGFIVNVEGIMQEAPSSASALSAPVRRAGHTVMRDDFSGSTINRNYWDYEISMYGGYNWEIQVYTNDHLNVYQKNGHLFIRPTLTSDKFGEPYLHNGVMDVAQIWGSCTNADRYGCHREGRNGLLPPIMSGKLKSKPTIRFGHVEVRARTPCGDWIWPALWMLPRDSHYGGWPRSGEIDLMESRGNPTASDGHVNHGNHEVSSTLHWGPDAGQNRFSMTHGEKHDSAWCQGFHTYTLDWTIDHIVASVDNHVIMNVPINAGGFWQKGHFGGNNIWGSGTKAAPFDQPFYFIMNVAVGGTNGFFPDNWHYDRRKPWNNNSPTEPADFWSAKNEWYPTWNGESAAMEIDYIEMKQY
jgi:hypothetical protein